MGFNITPGCHRCGLPLPPDWPEALHQWCVDEAQRELDQITADYAQRPGGEHRIWAAYRMVRMLDPNRRHPPSSVVAEAWARIVRAALRAGQLSSAAGSSDRVLELMTDGDDPFAIIGASSLMWERWWSADTLRARDQLLNTTRHWPAGSPALAAVQRQFDDRYQRDLQAAMARPRDYTGDVDGPDSATHAQPRAGV